MITWEFVLNFPALPRNSCLSNSDDLRDLYISGLLGHGMCSRGLIMSNGWLAVGENE